MLWVSTALAPIKVLSDAYFAAQAYYFDHPERLCAEIETVLNNIDVQLKRLGEAENRRLLANQEVTGPFKAVPDLSTEWKDCHRQLIYYQRKLIKIKDQPWHRQIDKAFHLLKEIQDLDHQVKDLRYDALSTTAALIHDEDLTSPIPWVKVVST